MFFLCHWENLLIKIEKTKQGLIAQNCGGKSISLLNNVTDEFCATIDINGMIHIIAKNLKGQIIYITYKNSTIKRILLFEELGSPFIFENFHIISHNNSLNFFYTAYDNISNTKTLLYQVINAAHPTVETIITNFTAPKFICIANNNSIFILFQPEQNSTEIQCLTLSLSKLKLDVIISAKIPILYYNATIINDEIHLLYLQNMYGQNQLIYKSSAGETPIATPLRLENASLLKFADSIWVNFVDNNILYTALSFDEAKSFSTPAKSSIQTNLIFAKFISSSQASIEVNQLFAQVTSTIRLATIASIDTIGMHPDLKPNIELEMLLESVKLRQNQQISQLQQQVNFQAQQIAQFQQVQKQQQQLQKSKQKIQPYPQHPQMTKSSPFVAKEDFYSPNSPKKPMSVKEAADAFMHNFNTFDAPMNHPK
ncbi:hypothetical protein AN641_02655 [Candidatus Epulonipiscioides gigas]|nr:hypothetical protein AN641_02655 [Epulopiscium sp. SCG-C07WGA-EpuloA2]